MRRLALLLALLFAAAPALAGVATSGAPTNVSVTIYRDPAREDGAMDARWPGGYALISETRRVHIPAGDSVLRFEGVAEGMLPETAIVTGLPEGVREKNRDARLISPAGLVDAYLRRSVHLVRTNRKTGKVIEQDAVIRAGPDGGVVLETREGVEALGCSGLPERMRYDGVPEGLSAKPTLSVLTSSARDVDVTITLSYLAQGFDWSANYVADMDEGGQSTRLFAWLTVANGGAQSFADARLQVVAGQPNKEEVAEPPAAMPTGLTLQCWPMDATSGSRMIPPHPEVVAPAPVVDMASAEAIIVTGSRMKDAMMRSPVAVVAEQEDLGDLKLYRVPIAVTVAAQGQKQIAMIEKPEAKFRRVYVGRIEDEMDDPAPMILKLRAKNIEANGLGVPLPAGQLNLFETVQDERLLAAQANVADRAIGERFEIEVGESPDVQWQATKISQSEDRENWRIEISNARPIPIDAELSVRFDLAHKPKGAELTEDGWILKAHVPANGKTVLRYALKLR